MLNGADDFEDSEEIYEAVGEVLQEVASDKSEEDIKLAILCNSFNEYVFTNSCL